MLQDKYFLKNIFDKVEDEGVWVSSINKCWKESFSECFSIKNNSYRNITSIKRLKYLVQFQSICIPSFADFLAKEGIYFRMFKYILTLIRDQNILEHLIEISIPYCKSKYFMKLMYTIHERGMYYIPDYNINYNVKFFRTYSSLYGVRYLVQEGFNFIYTALLNHNLEVLRWFKNVGIITECEESFIHIICDYASEEDDYIDVLKWVYKSFGDKVLLEKNTYLYKCIEYKSFKNFIWIYSLYLPLKNEEIDIYRIFSYYDSDLLYDPDFDQNYWDTIFNILGSSG